MAKNSHVYFALNKLQPWNKEKVPEMVLPSAWTCILLNLWASSLCLHLDQLKMCRNSANALQSPDGFSWVCQASCEFPEAGLHYPTALVTIFDAFPPPTFLLLLKSACACEPCVSKCSTHSASWKSNENSWLNDQLQINFFDIKRQRWCSPSWWICMPFCVHEKLFLSAISITF